ncbi:MAG: UDP-N-acetylmuramoyl-L-alanyl-D-glutamate--2,6-diaminopimelate ligase [Myxococcota bacterium]
MHLSDLISALPPQMAPVATDPGAAGDDPLIRGVRYDSRQVSPGDLFVALRGTNSDGHDYLERALELGAAALLVEELPKAELRGRIPAIQVPETRRALAPIAARFFGDPADELGLVGVTGTNGKTSTTYLVEAILQQAKRKTGLIGTVEIRFGEHHETSVNTTPESLDLQRTLRAMRNEQIDAAVMEVSSHGLELGRVEGCRFRVAAFTNLSQDHLDFHGDMEGYLNSKARLFRDHLAKEAVAVVNIDDAASEKILAVATDAGARCLRVGRGADAAADLRLVTSEIRLDGTRAELEDESGAFAVDLPLLGDFNLENLLVAVGIARALGIDTDTIAAGVAACPQVPGRMERVVGHAATPEPTVLVDYAHTPDAVEKLLCAVRPLCKGRLIAVFGCGGDRDRAKRPLMAEAAARHADLAIATSDNPRTEDPDAILVDVEAGLAGLQKVDAADLFKNANRASEPSGAQGCYAVISDRREAIGTALAGAGPDDTVVIAGKGHEDYQIIGREKFPFDDRREARLALLARGDA